MTELFARGVAVGGLRGWGGGGRTIDAFNTWTGPRATKASELYGMLEGVSQLSKWDGVKWVSYGETDGLLNSGSTDFSIFRGTVLWLDSR